MDNNSTERPVSRMVDVDGKKMHVTLFGSGGTTVVLMPGMGVALPSVDFEPLARDLAQNHRVAIVEWFGYGLSDNTHTPRTNVNYARELRQALRAAGLEPPYILMPHSISGVYAEYYAAKFPEEVHALVLLDTTSTAENDTKLPGFVIEMSKRIAPIKRITSGLELTMIGVTRTNGYTAEDIKAIKTTLNHAPAMANQLRASYDNVTELLSTDLPANVPILNIRADYRNSMTAYVKKHQAKLGANAKLVTIKGSNHMSLYHKPEFRRAIHDETEAFLDQLSGLADD